MARQAIQALDKILQYRQQEKRADVQEALAFMQYGMQKRAADVKEYGLRMEMLKQANQQYQLNIADNFLQSSGLKSVYDIIPTGIEDADVAEEGLKEIIKKLKKEKIGGVKAKFNEANATEIASGLWSYKNTKDPSALISLANRIESLSILKKGTDSDKNLLKSFQSISNLTALRQVGQQAKKSLENRYNILEEQFKFAEGDTDIQKGIGMLSKEVHSEYQKSKQQQMQIDESSIADLIEKEIEDPSSEVSGERIFKQGYVPKTSDELIEQTSDFLTKEEQSIQKDKMENITSQQLELEEALNTLVQERQNYLDEYEELLEDKEIAEKRMKYFDRINDETKRKEASIEWRNLDNLLNERNRMVEGSPVREKTAFERVSFYGENVAQPGSNTYAQIKGTKSEEIVKVKQAIRELERQRNLLAQ